MRAFGLEYDEHRVEGFFTLNDVRRFVQDYESGYQYITINPVPDPNVPPNGGVDLVPSYLEPPYLRDRTLPRLF
jgi:hypothetical protein